MHIFNMSATYLESDKKIQWKFFNMSVTYLQNAEKIQWKLLEELFHKEGTINHYLVGAVVQLKTL